MVIALSLKIKIPGKFHSTWFLFLAFVLIIQILKCYDLMEISFQTTIIDTRIPNLQFIMVQNYGTGIRSLFCRDWV